MMAVPPVVLDLLELKPGSVVGMDVDGERLVILPKRRARYTLDELLAESGRKKRLSRKDREWIDLAPAGKEL
jgi:antitoxin component of MazEF toxin-antitoxin module